MPEVVCLGIIVVDVWARGVDRWPARGTLGLVDEIGMGLGGCAANAGITFARLGGEVVVMGAVGHDGFGDFALSTLREAGVEVSVARVDAPTSATLITVHPDGERTFLHCTGADGRLTPELVDMDLVASAGLLHLAGVNLMPGFDGEPEAQVLRAAQARGVTTLVDTAWDDTGRWMETLRPLLPHTDLLMSSIGEAQALTGEMEPPAIAQRLLDEGAGLVGVKLGPEGSYFRTADRELRLPAYPVHPVDGTGAGDAFVAGFSYGWLRGWDLEDIGRFANAVGGLATTALGHGGEKSYEDTVAMIEAWDGRPWTAGS
ncbi:MAG TPA: sugar kinase [Armatimonadota bacterium]|jgi:sugar/nucleoside kinase (ribokinase family)